MTGVQTCALPIFNQLIDAVPPEVRTGALTKMRAIDTMVVVPSEDLRSIAYRHRREMPLPVRGLLSGISGRNSSEDRLVSFLLFEQTYSKEPIPLGYKDAIAVKDQLLYFVTGV